MILILMVNNEITYVGIAESGIIRKAVEEKREVRRPELLKIIDSLTRPDKISGIIVFRGPGPFTGTRVAVSIANALSYALKIPIVGIKDEKNPEKLLEIGEEKLNLSRLALAKAEKSQMDQILPFYDKEPSITYPKDKSKSNKQ
ncbi:MAG: Glycoprotease, peptidase M22 family [candidate division CPR2 bacterium GW2011_GWC2_39_10]|uniref:Glycoprotease, peptidase M22 family n=1 Tax=candidate division CPR2 bacterium GW2011_GWC2_39_10 TaxID=1618345 RepID=A0A0G0LSP6_UNCC2|nr:MAG: Glycoprotease, peptidase M22 family [candidate division CPR2 bacterium GW2011_GWC2_39_10]